MGSASGNFGKSKSRQSSGPSRERMDQSREIWRAAQDAAANPITTQQLMNPYQQQVIDRMNEQFGVQNQMTTNALNDQATRAGAFGGSRHGVAQGVALAENARTQAGQVAGLLHGGYESGMDRLGELAPGMYNPDLWRMNVLKQGVAGQPYWMKGKNSSTNFGFGAKVGF